MQGILLFLCEIPGVIQMSHEIEDTGTGLVNLALG